MWSNLKLFGISFLAAFIVGLALMIWLFGYSSRPPQEMARSDDGIGIRPQLMLDDPIFKGTDLTYKTIIDLRPDGEEAGQPSSQHVKAVSEAKGMAFFYIPTPHGVIEQPTVAALTAALAQAPKPVLLYCRSGKRATRVLALAMASDPQGPAADVIIGMVQAKGFEWQDIQAEIEQRIAKRPPKNPQISG